jgi:hypothetical protein
LPAKDNDLGTVPVPTESTYCSYSYNYKVFIEAVLSRSEEPVADRTIGLLPVL